MRHSLIPCLLSVAAVMSVADLPGGAAVQAHSNATGVVKERMDLMKSLGGEVKELARMFKGETPYDPRAVAASAKRIENLSGGHMLRLFPDGSTDAPSEAKADIWRHWPEFEAQADDLGTRASILAVFADQGEDQARLAFGRVVDACKSCHQDFKQD